MTVWKKMYVPFTKRRFYTYKFNIISQGISDSSEVHPETPAHLMTDSICSGPGYRSGWRASVPETYGPSWHPLIGGEVGLLMELQNLEGGPQVVEGTLAVWCFLFSSVRSWEFLSSLWTSQVGRVKAPLPHGGSFWVSSRCKPYYLMGGYPLSWLA